MRGIEGKIEAIRYARTHQVPYFGICLGMQCAVVEFARSVLGLEDANSTEFDKTTDHPVIGLMEDQRSVSQRGGTMRLGAWPCMLAPDRLARQAYGVEQDQRTASPSLRVQQRLPQGASRSMAWSLPEPARTARSSRSSSCCTIPGSWPCSSTPNSSPSRPRPIPSSAISWALRSEARDIPLMAGAAAEAARRESSAIEHGQARANRRC